MASAGESGAGGICGRSVRGATDRAHDRDLRGDRGEVRGTILIVMPRAVDYAGNVGCVMGQRLLVVEAEAQ